MSDNPKTILGMEVVVIPEGVLPDDAAFLMVKPYATCPENLKQMIEFDRFQQLIHEGIAGVVP